MFDQAPNNLPIEPEDILADKEESASAGAGSALAGSAPSSDASAQSGASETMPPTALSAGRLRHAVDSSSPLTGSAGVLSGAGLSPARSFAQSMSNNAHDTAPEDMQSDVEISPPILNKRNLFIISVIALVILITGGAFWVWRSSSKRAAAPSGVSAPQIEALVAPSAELNEDIPVSAPDTIAATTTEAVSQPPSPAIDADGDGLTDQQEIQYGTDPQKADTDGDGLTDYEEIFIWHTNPLNPDTDGDGFLDGQEVKNGFNPNGSGKILNIPGASSPSGSAVNSAPITPPAPQQ